MILNKIGEELINEYYDGLKKSWDFKDKLTKIINELGLFYYFVSSYHAEYERYVKYFIITYVDYIEFSNSSYCFIGNEIQEITEDQRTFSITKLDDQINDFSQLDIEAMQLTGLLDRLDKEYSKHLLEKMLIEKNNYNKVNKI